MNGTAARSPDSHPDAEPGGTGVALHRHRLSGAGSIHLSDAHLAMAGDQGPQRRITDHWHPDYWTRSEQQRHEDKMIREVENLESAVRMLANRVTLMLGALALIGFLIPIVVPFIRSFLVSP
jgi:hypothetical protein